MVFSIMRYSRLCRSLLMWSMEMGRTESECGEIFSGVLNNDSAEIMLL
jgi:hypothetical protein